MADPKTTEEDPPETTYDPSTVEVDRGREQGLGMGARDLARQRDPGGVQTEPLPGDTEDASDEEV